MCDETEAESRGGRRPFVFIKSYYPPCKKLQCGQARLTFLNRHCARNAFLPPPSPSSPPFHLFVCCVAAAGHGAQLPGMTLRIGCFDGNNVSAWNYDSPFRRAPIRRNAVCTLFVARVKNRGEKRARERERDLVWLFSSRFFIYFFVFLLCPGFDFYSMINTRNQWATSGVGRWLLLSVLFLFFFFFFVLSDANEIWNDTVTV